MLVTDQKKNQIIDAAIAEFQERGFAGSSMDRISERANVSKRTVYNHFDSKEALFRSINQCLADQLNAALEISYEPDQPVRDMLITLGWAEGNLMINPCFMSLARMIMSETIRDPVLAADMIARMTKLAVFEEFIARAGKEGKLKVHDPKLAAEQFLGLIKARGFYPNIYANKPATREEMTGIIEQSVDMILSQYGVPASA